MKANELMIGDWVQNPLGAKGWVKNIRLFPKESDGFGGYYVIDVAYNSDGDSYAKLEEKDIRPIPLTPEILEKNGFKKLRVSWILRDGITAISLQYVKDKWSLCVSHEIRGKDEEGRADLVTFCRDWVETIFVHELQHALKDCKIEKEIIL